MRRAFLQSVGKKGGVETSFMYVANEPLPLVKGVGTLEHNAQTIMDLVCV